MGKEYKGGQAGKSTRKMAAKRRSADWFIGIVIFIVAIVICILVNNPKFFGIGGAGVLLLLVLIYILPNFLDKIYKKGYKEEKRAVRGAIAEEKIGELLAGLSEDFYVLHDIVSPYGNIDHIVISKQSGVFLLETKAHGGKVNVINDTLLVNGKPPEKDFIGQALRNAYWLRDEINKVIGTKPWITPVIVFTNAFVISTKPIKGVFIINKKYLLNILHKQSRINPTNTSVWESREKIGGTLV